MKILGRLIVFAIFIWLGFLIFNPLPRPYNILNFNHDASITVLSRQGVLLRKTLAQSGGRRDNVSLNAVSSQFVDLLIHTEDQRFFYHPGVDPAALVRAAYQWIRHGKVISGGSTLTMQVARMMNHGTRNLSNKLKEICMALYFEMALSKNEILEIYLNHLPFANEIYGIKEASEVYFRKLPKDLSVSESASLLGIIRSPQNYNPYTQHERLMKLKERIVTDFAKGDPEKLSESDRDVVFFPLNRYFLAPHFSDFVLNKVKYDRSQTQVLTSLDLELNEAIEGIVQRNLKVLEKKKVTQSSVLVVKNNTGEIVGYVGSNNYWDDQVQGMNDGVLQFRQPGSTLKTLTYARAMDLGVEPSHVLPDVERIFQSEIGDYIPENYDRKFRGPVLMRFALANSLNVPAVSLLKETGVIQLYQLLKDLEFSRLTEQPSYYGLGLTLGNVETNLYELVRAYSIFARDGKFCDLTFRKFDEGKTCLSEQLKPRQLLSPRSASIIRDFLSDRHARQQSFGSSGPLDFEYPVMIKTGTSQNYKDNWTVAVTPEYTIGVWTGNFNADPMQDVSGVTGAAPVAHDVVEYLHKTSSWSAWPEQEGYEKVRVCALSGKKPGPFCAHSYWEFAASDKELESCDFHKMARVDIRNGLLAGSQCPLNETRDNKYLTLPDIYLSWQTENEPDSLLPQRFSNFCPQSADDEQSNFTVSGHFKILSPKNGAVYKIDLHRPLLSQYLSLKTTDDDLSYKIIYDGKLISKNDSQQMLLKSGKHHLELRGLENEKILDQINFEVR